MRKILGNPEIHKNQNAAVNFSNDLIFVSFYSIKVIEIQLVRLSEGLGVFYTGKLSKAHGFTEKKTIL